MEHVLALDVGTTAVKAVVLDETGHELAAATQEYQLITPAPDHVELDVQTYWQAVVAAARAAMKQLPPAATINSVGVTSQGETLIVLDDAGRPLRRAIVWLDNRAAQQTRAVAERFDVEEAYRITGQQEICPTWTACKLLWVRDREPDIFRRVRKALMVGDYILYRLTGRYVSERGMNSATLYFDITRGAWWPDMLDFIGLSAGQLPELVDAATFTEPIAPAAASELGLAAGTAVTAAPMDQFAAAIGAGNIAPGIVTEATGAALAICATVRRPVYSPTRAVPLFLFGLDGLFALLPWHPTAGMSLRWLRDCLGAASYDELGAQAAGAPIGSDRLLFLPHLSGAGCPDMNAAARGVFWGLTLGHSRAHLVRAVMESVACLTARNIELMRSMGVDISQVRALGGGSRSRLWCQIKADVLNLPVRRMEHAEATSMGVALLSLLARGVYPSAAQAAAKMVRAADVLDPQPSAVQAYREVYARYCRLDESARPLFAQV